MTFSSARTSLSPTTFALERQSSVTDPTFSRRRCGEAPRWERTRRLCAVPRSASTRLSRLARSSCEMFRHSVSSQATLPDTSVGSARAAERCPPPWYAAPVGGATNVSTTAPACSLATEDGSHRSRDLVHLRIRHQRIHRQRQHLSGSALGFRARVPPLLECWHL